MRATIVPALIAVALLAGCSADADDASPDPSSSPAATTTPASASASTDPSDGTSDSPDSSDTSDASDSADGATAGADLYCEPAQAGITSTQALFEATDRKSTQTGIEDDGGDVGLMNAAGEEMLVHAEDAMAHWNDAREHLESPAWDDASYPVSADEVDAAIEDYDAHMVTWVIPEAEIAASAGTIAEYDQATVALLADPEVIAAAQNGGEALGTMLGYTAERCDGIDALDP
ncbi:hypothetical protein [Demequina sp. NBRC 110056]|uniref:hypothetical protein n=1 Tax=Demequina sp. NBRC 110056 TaxID=1570345 RepID=UPI0009FFA79C|nr:hypothetical protein [Demequina sp. NBRC 110056]